MLHWKAMFKCYAVNIFFSSLRSCNSTLGFNIVNEFHPESIHPQKKNCKAFTLKYQTIYMIIH